MSSRKTQTVLLLLCFGIILNMSMVASSHIDDKNGELSNFTYDKVIYKVKKDCSLDRMPGPATLLRDEAQRYPDLDVFLIDEGEPRFELLKDGKLVDKIRIPRHDIEAIQKLLADLGVKRDEEFTWEKKAARLQLEDAFKKVSLNEDL